MKQKLFRKKGTILLSATLFALAVFLASPSLHALEQVADVTTASDGVKVTVGIKNGYEQSDATGKNLDPIMYYGKLPDVETATALDVEKAWWYQIRGQFAENAYAQKGGIVGGYEVGARIRKTNKRGLKRLSATRRSLSTWPKLKGIDYKDAVAFMSPEDMRGIATIIWRYADFNKDYDQWLWVPALRKVRKLGAGDREDSFGGMDIDYDDMVLRTPFDDAYTILRVETVDDKFIAGQREVMSDSEDIDKMTDYFKNEAYGHKMWVIESVPKEGRMSYHKRVLWFEQNIFRMVKSDWYDEKGRLVRISYRGYAEHPFYGSDKKHIFENVTYVKNTLTGHHTEMNTLKVSFNNPAVKPEMFSIRSLMRSRW
jgi:hypothetical protein